MLAEVIQRQLAPVLSMLTEAIRDCPEELMRAETVGVREHIYHVLVGMDVWLHSDPTQYPFGEIVDDEAANLAGPASARISREFLLDYVTRIEAKIAALCVPSGDLLSAQMIRGTSFTALDFCLSQLRHPMYHLGVINHLFRTRNRYRQMARIRRIIAQLCALSSLLSVQLVLVEWCWSKHC